MDVPSDFDPLFWFLDWGKKISPDSELSKYIASTYVGELQQSDIHCAELHFYNNFNLLRVTFTVDSSEPQSGAKPWPRRGYALYRLEKDGFQVGPLNGTLAPIDEINRIPGELNLVEDTADEYLRFFCSAVYEKDWPLLNPDPENYNQVVDPKLNRDAQAILKKEKGSWLRRVRDDEREKLSNPFPQSRITPRVACIIYSSTAFRTWFTIDNSNSAENPGMVQMLEYEPILPGLKVNIPRYGDGSLFVFNRLPESLPEPAQKPVDHKQLSAEKFNPPKHYYSVISDKRDEVDRLLTELIGSRATLGDIIEVEVVFHDVEAKERK